MENKWEENDMEKINVSKGKPVEESSEDDNIQDESSDEVFCVV